MSRAAVRELRRLGVLILVAASLGVSSSGCQHTLTVKTEPPGAEVFINLTPQGPSPVAYVTRRGLPDEAKLRVSAPGFKPLRDIPLAKSYRADATLLWLIPGVFPYFFTARFDDEVTINLEREPNPNKTQ